MIDTVPKAQILLNDIHDSGIFDLYVSNYEKQQQTAEIKLVKQKLRLVKRQLREYQSDVKSRWDARKGNYEKQMQSNELIPLNLVENYLAELDVAILELENSTKFDKPIPDIPIKYEIVIELADVVALKKVTEVVPLTEKKNKSDLDIMTVAVENLNQSIRETQTKLDKMIIGFFSRGRLRKKLAKLRLEYKEAKHSLDTIKMLIRLQEILEYPFTVDYVPQVLRTVYDERNYVSGLQQTQNRIQNLKSLKQRISSILPEHVDYIDDILNAHIDLQVRLAERLNEKSDKTE